MTVKNTGKLISYMFKNMTNALLLEYRREMQSMKRRISELENKDGTD